MTLSNTPNSPLLGDWTATVAAFTNLNQAGYANSLTAKGTGQTNGLQLSQQAPLVEVDTVAGSTGVLLPPAVPGALMFIFNNGANPLSVYGFTAADTINNVTTAFSIAIQTGHIFFCAKSGSWCGV